MGAAATAPGPNGAKAAARRNNGSNNGVHTPPGGAALQGAEGTTLSGEQMKELYRAMLLIRTMDERMITLQRQGRVGFYGACTGQEAATCASAYALRKSDWVFPALREGGVMMMRGFPLAAYLSQVFGNSGDITKGRQMPSHQMGRAVNQVSCSRCRWCSSARTTTGRSRCRPTIRPPASRSRSRRRRMDFRA